MMNPTVAWILFLGFAGVWNSLLMQYILVERIYAVDHDLHRLGVTSLWVHRILIGFLILFLLWAGYWMLHFGFFPSMIFAPTFVLLFGIHLLVAFGIPIEKIARLRGSSSAARGSGLLRVQYAEKTPWRFYPPDKLFIVSVLLTIGAVSAIR